MAVKQLGQEVKVWYDPEGSGYVMLDVTDNITPLNPIKIEGQKLLPKSEYHCSLVAARKLANDKISEQEIIELVRKFLVGKIIQFESLGKELYVCRKGEEVTVIARAQIIGIEDLRREIRKFIPDYAPFPHVTLLQSENSRYGIGVNSPQKFAEYCQKLAP